MSCSLPVVSRARSPGGDGSFTDRSEHQRTIAEVDSKRRCLRGLVADQRHRQITVITGVGASLEHGCGDGGDAVGGERLEEEGSVLAWRGEGETDDSVHQREVLSSNLMNMLQLLTLAHK